jgi:hypothetical protein
MKRLCETGCGREATGRYWTEPGCIEWRCHEHRRPDVVTPARDTEPAPAAHALLAGETMPFWYQHPPEHRNFPCVICHAPTPATCLSDDGQSCIYCYRRSQYRHEQADAEGLDERIAAVAVTRDPDPVSEWAAFESPTWEE